MAVARLIRLVTGIVVTLIVAAIVLRLLAANPHNVIVSDVHDAGRWLVGPFANVFSIHGAKAALAVNWGLAAVVYLIAGNLLARLIGRASLRGARRMRPVV
jgi:hypothetical protein